MKNIKISLTSREVVAIGEAIDMWEQDWLVNVHESDYPDNKLPKNTLDVWAALKRVQKKMKGES